MVKIYDNGWAEVSIEPQGTDGRRDSDVLKQLIAKKVLTDVKHDEDGFHAVVYLEKDSTLEDLRRQQKEIQRRVSKQMDEYINLKHMLDVLGEET